MKKKLHLLVAFIAIVLALSSMTACVSEKQGIQSLQIHTWCEEITLGLGQSEEDYVYVNASGKFLPEDIVFFSEDESIATIEYTKTGYNNVYFKITGVGKGKTTVYAQTGDGKVKSEKMNVSVKQIVTDISFVITEPIATTVDSGESFVKFKTKNEADSYFYIDMFRFVSDDETVATVRFDEDYTWDNRIAVTPVGAGETCVYIETLDGLIKSEKLTVVVSEEQTTLATSVSGDENFSSDNYSQTVYITPTGKKYHLSSACAGKNAISRDLQNVIDFYEPCKKCAQ